MAHHNHTAHKRLDVKTSGQENVVIAKATVAKFNLALGTTTLSGEGLYTHPEGAGSAVATDFISTFVMGSCIPCDLIEHLSTLPSLLFSNVMCSQGATIRPRSRTA
jgi:hypothetical protein